MGANTNGYRPSLFVFGRCSLPSPTRVAGDPFPQEWRRAKDVFNELQVGHSKWTMEVIYKRNYKRPPPFLVCLGCFSSPLETGGADDSILLLFGSDAGVADVLIGWSLRRPGLWLVVSAAVSSCRRRRVKYMDPGVQWSRMRMLPFVSAVFECSSPSLLPFFFFFRVVLSFLVRPVRLRPASRSSQCISLP